MADAEARDFVKKNVEWFQSDDAKTRIDNLLTHQDKHGCWPKNTDTTQAPYTGKPEKLRGTFDNGATTDELRLLARAFGATDRQRYKAAFNRGLKCILDSQYKNGGWPQFPRPSGYHAHITFNDNSMVRLMKFLREVAQNQNSVYDFVPEQDRAKAMTAFNQGVQCILDCQIKVNGKLTAWCAQHDAETLEPRGARVYEHASLSGGESGDIVLLLMSLPDPSDEVVRSVRAAVEWFQEVTIEGVRYQRSKDTRRLVKDAKSAVWARFYDIKTNRPIFSGRDGKIKFDVAEIEAERRNGYAWYVTTGKKVAESWESWDHK